MPHDNRSFLKVVAKTFAVVEALAETKAGAGVTELSRKLNQPKATVFRVLYTLQELGYVQKLPSTESYRLTDQLEGLAGGRIKVALKRAARPAMERLLGRFEQTVNLAILDQGHGQVQYLEMLEGLRSIRMAATVNTYAPLHATAVGKSILAFLDPVTVDQVLTRNPPVKLTPKTITSVPALLTHLRKVRDRGYAVDNEETELGARCIAAPIFDSRGVPFAAISVSGPLSHIKHSQLDQVAAVVRRECGRISEQLGYISARARAGDPESADKVSAATSGIKS
jgi:IclR family transcriptional regulator, KDG regulon repressor